MDLLADFDHIRKGLPIVNWVEQQESLNFIRQRIKWQKDHFLHVHCECTNRAYSKTDQCRQCPEFQSSQDSHWPWFPCDRSLKWIEMNQMLHFASFLFTFNSGIVSNDELALDVLYRQGRLADAASAEADYFEIAWHLFVSLVFRAPDRNSIFFDG